MDLSASNRKSAARDGGIRQTRSPGRPYGMRLVQPKFVLIPARRRKFALYGGRGPPHPLRRRSAAPETLAPRRLFVVILPTAEDLRATRRGKSSSKFLERKASFPAMDSAGGRHSRRKLRASLRK